MPRHGQKDSQGRRPRPMPCPTVTGYRNDRLYSPDLGREGQPRRYLTHITSLLESIKGGRSTCTRDGSIRAENAQLHTRTLASRYWHSPQSVLAHPGTWEPLPLSRTSLYPLLQAPRCKIIQYSSLCWMYGLISRNQDKPGVTVFHFASTI